MALRPTLVALLLVSMALAGCTEQEPARTPGPTPTATEERFAVLGDSISRGFAAIPTGGNLPQEHLDRSWATGTFPESLSSRLIAQGNLTREGVYNDARSGARANDLLQQATQASVQRATHVAILMGANDLCRGGSVEAATPAPEFEQHVRAALTKLNTSLPKARLFVASIPNVTALREAFADDNRARSAWESTGTCRGILRADLSAEEVAAANRLMAAYNGALEAACREVGNCVYDGGALHRANLTRDFVSEKDFFHPSAAGQRAIAELAWPLTGWARPT
ncbi:MAG TPA: GDSL-type esterase/lipase family protein [Candidatus Thermoplasmatota archaeon]|nr:GDSL-type esterase/lipase family protein [Candidatus Thermoplasmatota archaeon]